MDGEGAPRAELPVQTCVTAAELAEAVGVGPTLLARLVRLGLVEPLAPGADAFPASTVGRLRRMLRLHRDLGVNFTGAAIVVDLLERLERLEAELARLRRSA